MAFKKTPTATTDMLLDLKKAFHTVNHKTILIKFHYMDVREKSNLLIKSYKKCVVITKEILCGVLQESILGKAFHCMHK